MELQVAHHVVKIYYPNGGLKELIEYNAAGQMHGQHLYYLEGGLLDVVHFYENGILVCSL
jgi:antitoxin component YwqK of YwqJK toxin-antitoxin module